MYGENRYYPICKVAKLFAQIAGTVTLTLDNLERIRDMGYKLELAQEEIN